MMIQSFDRIVYLAISDHSVELHFSRDYQIAMYTLLGINGKIYFYSIQRCHTSIGLL